MEKKMSTEDHLALLETLTKNWYLFWYKAMSNGGFVRDLERIANMDRLATVREDLPFLNPEISLIKWYSIYPESYEKILDISKKIRTKMTLGHILEMNEVIDAWMDKLDLGPEWKDSLITLITTGILCPPIYTFSVDTIPAKENKKSDLKLVTITLSPETSIDELRIAWRLSIKKLKEDAWPNFKKVNLTDGLKNNLLEEIKVRKAKKNLSTDFKYPDLNYIETVAIKGKENDPKAVKDIVMGYRRKLRDIENVKMKKFIVRKKKTYGDVAVELNGMLKNKEKKKKAALLRQHKHRSKK